jgi:AcrR family transcriptional regulator
MNERSFTKRGEKMSTSNKERVENSRQGIIEASHDLFVQQGFHGTSMRQIAGEAGIALGGLYNHFDSKEDVFHAVFLKYHFYHEVLPPLLTAEGETVEEFVRDAAKRMFKVLEGRPDFLNLMFIEIVEFKSIHVFELFESLLPQVMQIIERLIQKGQGKLDAVPPFMLLRTFLGMIFAYVLSEIVVAGSAPPEFRENAQDYFIDIYLHGVLADD